MSFRVTRGCGAALLASLATVSVVRGQDRPPIPSEKPARGNPAAVQRVHIEPEVMALAEIIRRMRDSVERMPNYTCRESILRERKRPSSSGWKPRPISIDRVKVDVAFVDSREMYSFPGADRFEETPLRELVGYGMSSTGDFASLTRALFVDRVGQVSYVGETGFQGGRAVRYDFHVPLLRSGYAIHRESGDVKVEFSGSIWADPRTKDLIRIETLVEAIPPPFVVLRIINRIDYQRVRIGTGEFQIPRRAHLETHFPGGGQNHNRIEFSGCREFSVHSELSFTDAEEQSVAATDLTRTEFSLPPETTLVLRLETEIHSATSGAGDEIRATLARDVERDGEVLAPAGAVAVGRLRRVERVLDPNKYYLIGLAFDRLEAGNRWARLNAKLTGIERIPGLIGEKAKPSGKTSARGDASRDSPRHGARPGIDLVPESGTGELEIWAQKVHIARGHRMVWTTGEPPPLGKTRAAPRADGSGFGKNNLQPR